MNIEVYYDVETSGLSVEAGHCVIQFAAEIFVDGIKECEINELVNPSTYSRPVVIDPVAISIHGYDRFEEYGSLSYVVSKIMHELTKISQKHKATLIGFNNSTFDKYFIEDMFNDQGKKFDAYFRWKQIDVFECVKFLQHIGYMKRTYNQKLSTIAEYFEIEPVKGWHDGLSDVVATRQILEKIKESLKC